MKQKAYIATQGTEPTLGINKPRKHLMESVVGIGADIKLVHSSPCPLSRTSPRDSVGLLADGMGGELENHCHAHQHT